MTYHPRAYICSECGPEFLLLLLSVSLNLCVIECYSMSLQIAVSPPIQKARLMLVSINFESSQLALTCIPFYCGVN